MDDSIQKVTDLIRRSQKVIVFTGAGVSTESGIPDFRSPGGVWQKYNPEDLEPWNNGKKTKYLNPTFHYSNIPPFFCSPIPVIFL